MPHLEDHCYIDNCKNNIFIQIEFLHRPEGLTDDEWNNSPHIISYCGTHFIGYCKHIAIAQVVEAIQDLEFKKHAKEA